MERNNKAYRGWDVHSYTTAICEEGFIPNAWKQPVTRSTVDGIAHTLPAQSVRQVVAKMINRSTVTTNGNLYYTDPHLDGMNILALFVDTYWAVVKANDPSVTALWHETLRDAGQTCTQGDSHRLYSLYWALVRDSSS